MVISCHAKSRKMWPSASKPTCMTCGILWQRTCSFSSSNLNRSFPTDHQIRICSNFSPILMSQFRVDFEIWPRLCLLRTCASTWLRYRLRFDKNAARQSCAVQHPQRTDDNELLMVLCLPWPVILWWWRRRRIRWNHQPSHRWNSEELLYILCVSYRAYH